MRIGGTSGWTAEVKVFNRFDGSRLLKPEIVIPSENIGPVCWGILSKWLFSQYGGSDKGRQDTADKEPLDLVPAHRGLQRFVTMGQHLCGIHLSPVSGSGWLQFFDPFNDGRDIGLVK